MHAHEPTIPITRYEQSHERAHQQTAIAALLLGVAALIFSLAVLLYVLWSALASVQATAFDADGVRCYHRAVQVSCLKTAEPPR
jgi:flagellar basal body-associated protein FliL